jgi:uncharacterized protein (DUF305 family)
MYNETLRDALEWTSNFHSELGKTMQGSSELAADERSALLLEYLAKHEENLARLVKAFKEEGDNHALNTWCREHFEKKPVIEEGLNEKRWEDLAPDDLVEFVVFKHSQILDLYNTLLAKAPIDSMKDLLTQLVQAEEEEIKKMMQGVNRLADA